VFKCVLNQCCYIYTSNWAVTHQGPYIQIDNCPATTGRVNMLLPDVLDDGCDGWHHWQLSAVPNRMLVTVRVPVLTVAGCQVLFDANIQCTYRS